MFVWESISLKLWNPALESAAIVSVCWSQWPPWTCDLVIRLIRFYASAFYSLCLAFWLKRSSAAPLLKRRKLNFSLGMIPGEKIQLSRERSITPDFFALFFFEKVEFCLLIFRILQFCFSCCQTLANFAKKLRRRWKWREEDIQTVERERQSVSNWHLVWLASGIVFAPLLPFP